MSEPGVVPLAVAVVSFDARDALQACLESVASARPVELVVVDNGSTDGSIELVASRFPQATLLVNERNRGYGAAANQAFGACTAPAMLLLNSDTVLAPDALSELGRYLAAHPSAGVVGPRLANLDGSLQPSTFPFPSVGDLLVGDTGLHRLVRRLPGLRGRFLRTWAHDVPRAVPWLRGAALAIRRNAFEAAGGFDEDFFMYWEEVDLCRRLAEAGFQTHYAPVTTVLHAGAASTSKRATVMRREWLVGFRRYLRRHESRLTAGALLRLLRLFVGLRAARDAARLRLSGDAERRRRLSASVSAARQLLAERELWRP
jgi:GT2 family glycosyltransferase